jgi:hypothetical protein
VTRLGGLCQLPLGQLLDDLSFSGGGEDGINMFLRDDASNVISMIL